MELKRLMHFVELPDTHRRLLSDYGGAYSLGIGRQFGDVVLVLQVEPYASQERFPNAIRLAGESVPVVVESNFVAPEPLSSTG